MISSLGSEGRLARKQELISRANERSLRRGRVSCASASTGRCVRTGGERSGVLQLSGITFGASHVHRAPWESGALALGKVGKDLPRQVEAGLMNGGEKMSLRPVICHLCRRSTVSCGRHDYAARIGTCVD